MITDSPEEGNPPLISGYQLHELLGRGGFGEVYKATQESTGQTVAIKLLHIVHDNGAPTARTEARFKRETQLCAELNHPHIVKLLNKGKTDAHKLYAVFEYVPGETLKERICRKGGLSAIEAGELMSQVLDALVSAHKLGVVHRDLKPHNIMVSITGVKPLVKVLDFGIGTVIPTHNSTLIALTLTLTQEALGTPAYCAPEQLRGEPPTIQSDLYAWGLVFLECLTGEPVIRGASPAEIYHKQLSAQEVPIPPAILNHPLAALLRRVLKKKPVERCQDGGQLWDDLKKINLGGLVGLQQTQNHPTGNDQDTFINSFDTHEIRNITALCCSISLTLIHAEHDSNIDIEALDALQQDQFNQCIDIASRFGGEVIGVLGDRMLVYFGYSHPNSADARNAARTALELTAAAHRQEQPLAQHHGVRLHIRIGLHTGAIAISGVDIPMGYTANTALRLENEAPPGAILTSETTFRRLEKYLQFELDAMRYLNGNHLGLQTYLLQENDLTGISFLPITSQDHPLVGRLQDFQQLTETWQATIATHGRAALICADIGMGKSRLIRELRNHVAEQGQTTYECLCLQEHENNALLPILELMRQKLDLPTHNPGPDAVARLSRMLGTIGADLEQVMPVFCSWFSLPYEHPETAPLMPQLQIILLLETISKWLLQQAKQTPLLLVVEDIHWMDPITRDLLDHLIPNLEKAPLLLVMTARNPFQSPWRQVTTLHLGSLSCDDVIQIAQNMLGKHTSTEVLEKIASRTKGVPLLVEELTQIILETHLMDNNGCWELKVGSNIDGITLTGSMG